uniref:Uncharacterized protein n=1 Tax=Toxoplasma gondii (strain ATCC 50861 / VEG) TaxID=432359 RepID=A0A0F7UU94_TOXGV|nr:TPA: hypothetical protein BN1205_045205 [Toxoplasma gondii VEG]
MGLPTNAEQVTGKTRSTMLPQNEFRQVGGGLTDSGIFLKDGTRPGRRLRMLHVWNDPTILRNKYTLGDVAPIKSSRPSCKGQRLRQWHRRKGTLFSS